MPHNIAVHIAVARIEITVPASVSLKDKRKVMQSIIQGAQVRHRLAAAEVDDHDLVRSGVVGMASVSGSRSVAMQALERAVRDVESRGDCVCARIECEEFCA